MGTPALRQLCSTLVLTAGLVVEWCVCVLQEVTVKQHELSAAQADYEVLLETNIRLKSELDTSRHDTAVQLSVKQQVC